MADQQIDLSAGLVNKPAQPAPAQAAPAPAPAAPAPAQNDDVDLTSGIVQKQPPAPEKPQSLRDKAQAYSDKMSEYVPNMNDMYLGFGKGMMDTSHGIGSLLNKIPLVGEYLAPKEGLDAMDKMAEAHGVMQHLGKGAELVAEFMSGDEALKGMSMVDKLKHMTTVAKFMQEYPRLGTLLAHGVSNSIVGFGQGMVKDADTDKSLGDTATQAGIESLAGAGTGAVLEGASGYIRSLINRIRPGATNIAGVGMPKLASQSAGADALAPKVANIGTEPSFALAQQRGTQQAIKNVASDSADASLRRMAHTIEPGSGMAMPQVKVNNFGEAATQLEAAAQPVYEKINTLTDGEFSRLRQQRSAAYKAKDYDGVKQAEQGIEDLFKAKQVKSALLGPDGKAMTTTKAGINMKPQELSAAKQAFKESYLFNDVHDAVNEAFNIGDEQIAKDAGVWRGIDGGKLMTRLNKLVERTGKPELQRVIGKEGLDNLYRIADLTQNPQYAKQFGNTVEATAMEMMPKRSITGAIVDESRRAVLHGIATNPHIAQMMENVAKSGNEQVYKFWAPAFAQAIRSAQQ